MANEQIKQDIILNIKENNNNEITGEILQSVLLAMVDALGEGAQFMGEAVQTTVPATGDSNMFYLAVHAGTYPSFNVTTEHPSLLTNQGGTWHALSLTDLPIWNGAVAGSIIVGSRTNSATDEQAYAEGYDTSASAPQAHAEGNGSKATGDVSHAEGNGTAAQGSAAHSEGDATTASGDYSHAEGEGTTASGQAAHAEGEGTQALKKGAHAEGQNTTANGGGAHAEGVRAEATAKGAHAEGTDTEARAEDAHAEGYATVATGNVSHAEGSNSAANGAVSHAEGSDTAADGDYSHAEGNGTRTTNEAEHAEGKFNKSNTGTRHSVGIGTSNNDRKNAVEVMDNGDVYVEGVGGYDGTNAGASGVQTIQDEMAHAYGFIFDVTKENSGATFASLSALLSSPDLSTLIPTSVRTGGMTIRFILTSDNKYVQLRYMGTETTGSPNPFLDTANWQGVDDVPVDRSNNLITSGGVFDELEKELNGVVSKIYQDDYTSNTWYTNSGAGNPLTLNTEAGCYAYKGTIPQGVLTIEVFGSGTTAGRLWYTLDSQENVVRLSDANLTHDIITLKDEEKYIVSQTNNISTNPGKIKFYSDNGIAQKVKELQEDIQELSSLSDVIFDIESIVESNTWYMGTTIGSAINKVTEGGCYAVKVSVLQNEVYLLSAKGGGSGRGWYLLDSSNKIVDCSEASFNDTIQLPIPAGVSYLIIQSSSGISYLSLSKLGEVSILKGETNKLEEDVQEVNTNLEVLEDVLYDTFKCTTPFLWNKLSRLKTQDSGFCNIGFIGDSWTQGTEDIIGGVNQGDYQGYLKPLSKMLQDEYGFGGLGWLDFARDGGEGKMFGCAEMYEHWSYEFSGNVTGLDGHSNSVAPYCLGICCAHTIFGNGASLTLTFDANYLDVFKLRYYKNAHFNVSVNGGTPVEVTANANDGWQETSFGTTGTNITSVVITSLADDTIIFGMDCFYGTKGVRCHKIGNRSIAAAQYLLMNEEQWESGVAMLDLCWASVLLAINDLGSSTSESTMDAIVSNISNLINRLKIATDDGNGLVTCDINVLGVENIQNAEWTGLGLLAKKQKAMALSNGYGWCSTDKCIGTKKTEFAYTGVFSDSIHLNKIGSYAYANHIYNSLFKF